MLIGMDEQCKKNIEETEQQLGHATGIGAISRNECPRGARLATACAFCHYGHMLDCHYPKTCEQAECSHYWISIRAVESF